MVQLKISLIIYLIVYCFAKRENSMIEKKVNDEIVENLYRKLNYQQTPTTTRKAMGAEVVIEKFVETLLSSEKYLKMIETVERKLNHLDATFHETTNIMTKYLTEIIRTIKSSTSEPLEEALKMLKSDLDKLKHSVIEKLKSKPNMRVENGDDHNLESVFDNRLSLLENNVKTIVSGVESIMATISEVKSRQYTRTYPKPELSVGGSLDALALINEFRKTLREQKAKKCDCKNGRFDRSERYPSDCHEIQMQGFNVSGIYKIKPDDMEPFYVLCDLNTAGGGWTVFQNRFDGSQDFYKGWSDYENGFGNLAGEFWLGLGKISCLTNQKLYELRIEIETQHGQDAYAGYSVFTVGPENEGYRISTLGTYYGTVGDSLSYHAGQKFSTYDVDNDEWKDGSCAAEHGGAWWYKECDKSNLNGKYLLVGDDHRGQSMYWISFKGPNNPLTKSKMMIRPLPASKPIDYGDNNRNNAERSKQKIIPDRLKSRTKDVKDKFVVSNRQSPYRFDEHARAEAFFPNYA